MAYEPNAKRGSVLELTVVSVKTGRIADFAAYQLDADSKKSRPYYAQVAGQERRHRRPRAAPVVPLYAVDTHQRPGPAVELQQHLQAVPLDVAARGLHQPARPRTSAWPTWSRRGAPWSR